jgi:uncharacterized small protein (DUF1192 family)
MISPLLSKLAAWLGWILLLAAVWAVALAFVARGTAQLRSERGAAIASQRSLAVSDFDARLSALQRENNRLRNDLTRVPELKAAAAQLRTELAAQESKTAQLWTGESNVLQTAIEQKQRELVEIRQWSSEWHTARQREAAEERLAEKAKQPTADPRK